MKVILLMIICIMSLYGKEISILRFSADSNNEYYTVKVKYNIGDSDSKVSLRRAVILEAKQAVMSSINSYIISNNEYINFEGKTNTSIFTSKSNTLNILVSSADIEDEDISGSIYKATVKVAVNKKEKAKLLLQVKEIFDKESKNFNKSPEPIVLSSKNIGNIESLNDDIFNNQLREELDKKVLKVDADTKTITLNELKMHTSIATTYVKMRRDDGGISYTFDTVVDVDKLYMSNYIKDVYMKDHCEEISALKAAVMVPVGIVGYTVVGVVLSPVLIPGAISHAMSDSNVFRYDNKGIEVTHSLPYNNNKYRTLTGYDCTINGSKPILNINVSVGGTNFKYPVISMAQYTDHIHIITEVSGNVDIKKVLQEFSVTLE